MKKTKKITFRFRGAMSDFEEITISVDTFEELEELRRKIWILMMGCLPPDF